jgi:hypothetical protein
MNGKPPKSTSTWITIPSPQFDAQAIYRKKLAPPPRATSMRPQSLLIAKGLRPESHLNAT